jgi:hypothetical protein
MSLHPPSRPTPRQFVHSGTCCDAPINVAIDALNKYDMQEYHYQLKKYQYMKDLADWQREEGKFKDPIQVYRGGRFHLDGTHGTPDRCAGSNQEDWPENRTLCQVWARNFGSPYWRDYDTVKGHSQGCRKFGCCIWDRWQPQCARSARGSNDHRMELKPKPPGGRPAFPAINMTCQCCQQSIDFTNLRAGGDIDVSNIRAICNLNMEKNKPPPPSPPSPPPLPSGVPTLDNQVSTNHYVIGGVILASLFILVCMMVLMLVL